MADNNNSNTSSDADAESQGESFGEPVIGEQTQGAEGSEEATQGTEQTGETGEESGATEGEQSQETATEPELTEKGTKKDPNPQSAVHQELANTRRDKQNMEAVLGDPEKLARFMEVQYGIKAQAPAKEGEVASDAPKTYTAADFENLDNVAEVVNNISKGFNEQLSLAKQEIAGLTKTVQNLSQGGQAQALYTKSAEDVAALAKEPELDPTSPDFIKGLESDIALEYHRLDFDEKTGRYLGKQSMKDIGDRLIAVARRSRQKGSQDAQTIVKDKSRGKVTTSATANDKTGNGEKSDPASSIAEGISKMNFQT